MTKETLSMTGQKWTPLPKQSIATECRRAKAEGIKQTIINQTVRQALTSD